MPFLYTPPDAESPRIAANSSSCLGRAEVDDRKK